MRSPAYFEVRLLPPLLPLWLDEPCGFLPVVSDSVWVPELSRPGVVLDPVPNVPLVLPAPMEEYPERNSSRLICPSLFESRRRKTSSCDAAEPAPVVPVPSVEAPVPLPVVVLLPVEDPVPADEPVVPEPVVPEPIVPEPVVPDVPVPLVPEPVVPLVPLPEELLPLD